jgi:transposase-like protein
MTRTDLRTYTPEFRDEAVKVVLEQGLSLEAAAQRLSEPKGTLANWVKAAKRGSTATASAPGSRSVAELEEENARLRRVTLPRFHVQQFMQPRATPRHGLGRSTRPRSEVVGDCNILLSNQRYPSEPGLAFRNISGRRARPSRF